MPSLSVCYIPVDASSAECDVSMDEKSTLLCTHPDSAHRLTSCLILGKPYTPKKEKERGRRAVVNVEIWQALRRDRPRRHVDGLDLHGYGWRFNHNTESVKVVMVFRRCSTSRVQ